jgi:hypothetical protein
MNLWLSITNGITRSCNRRLSDTFKISGDDSIRCLTLSKLIWSDDLWQFAAAAEVEPVDAGAQVVAASLHAVPGEHADASLTGRLTEAAQRLDLTVLTWKKCKVIWWLVFFHLKIFISDWVFLVFTAVWILIFVSRIQINKLIKLHPCIKNV